LRFERTILLVAIVLTVLPSTTIGYPDLEYYVTDDANVLLLEEIFDIEAVCLEVDDATGAEMAVLIVESTQPDGIDMFAVGTFEESGIGKEGEDNGLLLLISVEEREWRIEVGYGLEGLLPDLKVDEIADTYLVPYLQTGNYYEGILYTLAEIGWMIVEDFEGDPPKGDDGSWYPIPWIPLVWWQLLIAISVTLLVALLTGGRIFLWIGGSFGGGRGGFGGGRSGGGGASGKW
jgi:uncharacterized protein